MHVSRPARRLRPALALAALGLLVALFLLQTPQARAQVFDATPPSLQVANVDGSSLVIIYDELLDESSTPAASDYTVDIGGTDYTPSSVAVRGAEVALTLSTGASMGDTVALDYAKGTNPVKDLAGNDAVAETNRPVTNHTGATNDRPEFSSETITISVDENTPIMTAFGDPITATDDDTGDTLTYSLPANVLLLFGVGTNTGQFSTFAPLDFESNILLRRAALRSRQQRPRRRRRQHI